MKSRRFLLTPWQETDRQNKTWIFKYNRGVFQVFSSLEQIITLHSNCQCIFPTMMFWRGDEKLSGLYSVYDDDEVGDFPRQATWNMRIHEGVIYTSLAL